MGAEPGMGAGLRTGAEQGSRAGLGVSPDSGTGASRGAGALAGVGPSVGEGTSANVAASVSFSAGAPASAMERFESPQEHPSFDQFVATISALRASDGCPWDREQTHESIAHSMIEEAYEAVDAIEAGDVAHLREELGDVLLQVVLQSQIASDAGEFSIDEVCADVNEKMVRRHPHVFGQANAQNASEVLDLWDQVKLAEKGSADQAAEQAGIAREGLLDGVPASFPALIQAQKISRKAVAAGFEWETLDDVWAQVREEVAELNAAYAAAPKTPDGKVDHGAHNSGARGDDGQGDAVRSDGAQDDGARGRVSQGSTAQEAADLAAAVEMEFGDVLFSLVNVARRMGIDSESALRAACMKFRRRWAHMEQAAWNQGQRIENLPNEQQEALWKEAKELER